jgi:dynamin-like GTPase MGM1, mitochondrial
VEPYWRHKLDATLSFLTKSSVGRDSTALVADGLHAFIASIASGEPFTHYPACAAEHLIYFSLNFVGPARYAADQAENCIKPYKYEVDVDARAWEERREGAVGLFEIEVGLFEGRLGEISQRLPSRLDM